MSTKAMEKTARRSLLKDEKGAGFSEYLVLLVIVVVAGIAMWQGFKKNIETKTNEAGTTLQKMK